MSRHIKDLGKHINVRHIFCILEGYKTYFESCFVYKSTKSTREGGWGVAREYDP